MKPPKCRLCGHEHYGMAHVFATNTKDATNDATNRKRGAVVGEGVGPADVGATKPVRDTSAPRVSGKTANRRDREAYNAYQRELMRKRRADKKAAKPTHTPLGIPYG